MQDSIQELFQLNGMTSWVNQIKNKRLSLILDHGIEVRDYNNQRVYTSSV